MKWARKKRWPEFINGHLTRPKYGPCPACRVPEDRWCKPVCKRLDPMDYR